MSLLNTSLLVHDVVSCISGGMTASSPVDNTTDAIETSNFDLISNRVVCVCVCVCAEEGMGLYKGQVEVTGWLFLCMYPMML